MSEIQVGQRGQIGARYYVTVERYKTVTERATVIVDGASTPEQAEVWACNAAEESERRGIQWHLGNEQISECVAVRATQISDMAIIKRENALERPVYVPSKSADKENTTTKDMG